MKKFLWLLLLLIPFNAWAINLYSPKYIIYDNTEDKVLLEKDANVNVSIASLTKIMTALVVIEGENNLEKNVTVTKNMLKSVPSSALTMNLKRGEVYTYRDLLYATMLPSAADAAIVLAASYAGNIPNFVNLMNKKAKDLGLNNTNFTNPIGMDNNNNKTTLTDLLKLLKYALNNKEFKTIYTTKKYTMHNNRVVYTSLKAYNEDLGLHLDTSRIIGSKTGYTSKAGMSLSELFLSHDHEIISITVGAKHNNSSYHLQDGISIINYIDNNYNDQVLLEDSVLLKEIEVRDSTIDKYPIYSNKEIVKFLKNDYNKDNFKVEYNLPEYITYKSSKNLGHVNYYYEDELLYTQSIILQEDIHPNFMSILKDNIAYIIIGIALIILLIVFIIIRRKCQRKQPLEIN